MHALPLLAGQHHPVCPLIHITNNADDDARHHVRQRVVVAAHLLAGPATGLCAAGLLVPSCQTRTTHDVHSLHFSAVIARVDDVEAILGPVDTSNRAR